MATLNSCILTSLIIIFVFGTYIFLGYFLGKKSSFDPTNVVSRDLWPFIVNPVPFTLRDNKLTLSEVVWLVTTSNTESIVRNTAAYGPITAETPVIAIQVHKHLERLQYLVISLAQVRNIQSVLLVFSHSYYDDRINGLITDITFCKVMQIFYPNSVQLYPDSFPGTENCTGRMGCWPRDGTLTEPKHHWWWTAHHIFEENVRLRRHKGFVIFMSESSYVLPDLLHMLNHSRAALALFPEVKVLSFGRFPHLCLEYNKLSLDIWRPFYANGLAFNKSTWTQILQLSSSYCNFNHISWSESLMNVFYNFPQRRALTIACSMPRVISTATYQSGRDALEKLVRLSRSPQLFPKSVRTLLKYTARGVVWGVPGVAPRSRGGWSDPRDRLLCREPIIKIERSNVTNPETEIPTVPDLSTSHLEP